MSGSFDDETGGHGGDLAGAARRWNLPGGRLIDFSSNVNPLGPPGGLIEHLRGVLPEIERYPTPQARELRHKLASFLGVPEKRLILGNGANELIHLLALWKRPRKVFVPAPTFSEYERAAKLSGAQVKYYSLPPGKKFNPCDLEGEISPGDLVVFCNPSNPTGQLFPGSDLLSLARAAEERKALVMIDESFIPLTGRTQESLRRIEGGNLWIVLSLTKLWALPGLRLGCLVGPAQEAAELTRWGDPWRVNILAQEAGLYCLEQEGYLDEALALIEEERSFISRRLTETGGLRVFEGAANYLLVQGTDPGFDVADLQNYLAERGILIRRADNFHGLDRSYFRVAVLKPPHNRRLAEEIARYMKKLRAGSSALLNHNRGKNGGFSGGEGR